MQLLADELSSSGVFTLNFRLKQNAHRVRERIKFLGKFMCSQQSLIAMQCARRTDTMQNTEEYFHIEFIRRRETRTREVTRLSLIRILQNSSAQKCLNYKL